MPACASNQMKAEERTRYVQVGFFSFTVTPFFLFQKNCLQSSERVHGLLCCACACDGADIIHGLWGLL